ncbi:hypothetical protein [Streptomyces cremeus]|uniref:Uncharacterized protein n=1 Tax=Streptomyces cremeus TaxID=66881 RepID=A0ABV5PFR1_STRCM
MAGAAAVTALAGTVLGDGAVALRVLQGVLAAVALAMAVLPSRVLLHTGQPMIIKTSPDGRTVSQGPVGRAGGARRPGLSGLSGPPGRSGRESRRTRRALYVAVIVLALFGAALSALATDYRAVLFPAAMALFFLASMLLGDDTRRAPSVGIAVV